MQIKMIPFQDWCEKFKKEQAGDYALEYLKKLEHYRNPSKYQYPDLEERVLIACYHARRFEKLPDPLKQRRQQDNDVLSQISKQLSAISKLRDFISQHPGPAGSAFGLSLLDLKEKGVSITRPDGHIKASALLDEILAAYKRSLEGEILGVKSGPFIYRSQLGCLDYGRMIDRQKARPDQALNGLLFELVLLFRRWTAPDKYPEPFRISNGEAMPEHGKSCYRQASEFIIAALDPKKNLDEDDLKDRLRKLLENNPDVTWVGWPKVES